MDNNAPAVAPGEPAPVVPRVPIGRRLAERLPDIQRTYVSAQERALTVVGAAGGDIESGDKPLAVLQRLNGQLSTVQQLGHGLVQAYDEVLAN